MSLIRAYMDGVYSRPLFKPPDTIVCANNDPIRYWACSNPPKSFCGSCRLVAYCGKECQNHHWKTHKHDCKNSLCSDSWRPAWVTENRLPRFVSPAGGSDMSAPGQMFQAMLAQGGPSITLWGNMPAINLLGLGIEDVSSRQNVRVALPASGDLRHLIKTVNAIPLGYDGHISIALNDRSPEVTSRNVMLLLIMGGIEDTMIAADIAIHLWYSAFITEDYKVKLSGLIILKFVEYLHENGGDCLDWRLGPNAQLSGPRFNTLIARFIDVPMITEEETEASINGYQTMRAESGSRNRDRIDMKLSHLLPAHRLAFQEFKRTGVLLPFGALKAHFIVPNRSLFTEEGRWLQAYHADPLYGWSLEEVKSAGRAAGARTEDIYGCLYFFLVKEIRNFIERLKQLKITIVVGNADASTFSKQIRAGVFERHGLARSATFDRIHVSNIIDINYVGLKAVLTHWQPLLACTDDAVIVGYFMNWVASVRDGRAHDAMEQSPILMDNTFDRMANEGRILVGGEVLRPLSPAQLQRLSLKENMQHEHRKEIAKYFTMACTDFFYENSAAFKKYLASLDAGNTFASCGLTLRERHKIVPHRLGCSIGGKPSDLPKFQTEEEWYNQSCLQSHTGYERFIELGHAGVEKRTESV